MAAAPARLPTAPPAADPGGRAPAPPSRMLPVAATLCAIALFALMDALMKRASLVGGVYPALFARGVVGACALGPVWWLRGGRWPGRALLRLHLLRGTLATGMAGSFFYGLVHTPLAEGIAISFIAPVLALALAAWLLGEVIRPAAIAAALIGLAGVGVIAWGRLGHEAPTPGAARGIAAILFSAVLYAWNLILQRQQAQLASPLEVAFSQSLLIALTLALGAPLVWAGEWAITGAGTGAITGAGTGGSPLALLLPEPAAWPDIIGAALFASLSLMLLAWAYARTEAQWLVPLEYTAFGWSALMGWWWFGEAVTGWTLAGFALILAGVWLGARGSGTAAVQRQVPPG